VEFRLLGPVEAVRDGRSLPLGGAKPRALMALLLLHANEVVSRDRLIEGLWPDRAPGTARHSLDVQVSRLRKAFEPEEPLVTRSGGYTLEVEPEAIDAHRFERLLEAGRKANAAGQSHEALAWLETALALWRGEALGELAYEEFARPEADRLEELRLVASEERLDAELALGHHDRLVSELEALTARHPLRERLRGQLMLALYRSGRQAEALRVYSDTRARLVDELGIEPSQQLREVEQAILRQDPALDLRRRPLDTRRRRVAAGALALISAGIAAATVVAVTQGGTESAQARAEADSNVFLTADSGRVASQADAVRKTMFVRYGAGSLWSVSSEGLLTRIDPETGEIVDTIGLGIEEPGGLAFGKGSVWVTDRRAPTLLRIDPDLNEVVNRFALPTAGLGVKSTGEVAVGAGSVWVGHGAENPGAWVERIDPETGQIQKRFSILGGDVDHVAFGEGALWVASTPSGELRKIDPHTNGGRIVWKRRLQADLCCVAAGGGYVWAASNPEGVVWKITTDGEVLPTIPLSSPITRLTYADGALWAALGEAGVVVRVDPITNETRSYDIGHSVSGVDVRDGLVAAGVRQSDEDVRQSIDGVVEDLTGDIAWVGRKAGTLFDSGAPTEPAFVVNWDMPQVQFHYATCARLLNYRDVEGEDGRRLVPEVAARLPEVSDGGRTYTFTIREGFRFSPPSNEEVTAESFRRAAERAISGEIDSNPNDRLPPGLANIVGAQAYRAGKAPHISGIVVRGDKLVIRLRRPAPDLPWMAASSCAVPVDTPIVPDGIRKPVASAGPYYLAAHTDSFAVLKRNPNYGGSRPQHLDAIVFRFNVPPGDAAAEIENGSLDYFLESQSPTLTRNTLAARAADERYRMTPDGSAATESLRLNWERPLFASIRMRRAVQYALDRAALADIAYSVPATRLHSPKSPGFDDTPLYPLRPDLRTARKLSGGRKARAVFLTPDPKSDPTVAAFFRAVQDQLAAIGITVTALPLTHSDFLNGGLEAKAARSDLIWWGANAETADAVGYLRRFRLPQKEWDELNRIAKLSSPERERAAAALATRIERKSLYAVYAYRAVPELVSKRLGCIVHQPQYAGVDLAALCLKDSKD
jgi:DNA-binding SARP family transcriptional activator/ABC-type transport system substrate-binding protein/streptogramin lyase